VEDDCALLVAGAVIVYASTAGKVTLFWALPEIEEEDCCFLAVSRLTGVFYYYCSKGTSEVILANEPDIIVFSLSNSLYMFYSSSGVLT